MFYFFKDGMYIPGISIMNTGMLRYLDRILGKPASRIFFLIKRIARRKRAMKELHHMDPKKILLIKLRGIGSVILLSPVITNLRKKYPHTQIHFLTKKGLHTIYDDTVFDKIYSLNTGGILNAIKDFILVPLKLMREHYDLVIDFEVISYYTATLTFMINPQHSIGFKVIGKTKDQLYDFTVMYHESKHITQIFALPLKILGVENINYDLIPPSYTAEDEKKIVAKIPDIKNVIAINVNASDLAYERRRPAKYYVQLIDDLAENGEKILLTGDIPDTSYVGNIYHQLKHKNKVINGAGKYTLKEFFVILKSVKLFITNDSGPLHIAVAYQAPTISFFGPETPIIYGPNYKKELHKVFFMNLFCSPCISVFRDKNFVCNNKSDNINNCMLEITPEKVIRTVHERLIHKKF